MSNDLNSHTFSSYFNPFDTSFNQVDRFSELKSSDKFLIVFLTVLATPLFILPGIAIFRYLTEKEIEVLDRSDPLSFKVQNAVSRVIPTDPFFIKMKNFIKEKLEKDINADIEEIKINFIKRQYKLSLDFSSNTDLYINCNYLLDNLDKFNIKSIDNTFKIAEMILKEGSRSDVSYLIKNIDKFQFSKENKFKCIELCATRGVDINFTENFDKFGFSEEERLKIIKILANPKSPRYDYVIKNINKFGFSEEQRFEIATLLYKSNLGAKYIAENITLFEFSSIYRLKTAEILIKGHVTFKNDLEFINRSFGNRSTGAEILLQNIYNFRFSNEELFEVAKILATSSDNGQYQLCENLNKFNIGLEENYLQLAELLTTSDYGRESLARNIDKFNITSEQDRLRFANLLTTSDRGRESLAVNFDKFKITSEDDRLKILKLMLANPRGFNIFAIGNNIKKFKITNDIQRYELFIECLTSNPNSIYLASNFLPFPHLKVSNDYFLAVRNEPLNAVEIQSMIETGPYSEGIKTKLLDQLNVFKENPNPQKQHHLVFNLVALLSLNNEQSDWIIKSGFFDAIQTCRLPSLKNDLVSHLITFSKAPLLRKFWSDIQLNSKKINSMELLVLPFSRLQAEGVDEYLLKNILNILIHRSKSKNSPISNNKKNQAILGAVNLLAYNQTMHANEKSKILEKIFLRGDAGILENLFVKKNKGIDQDYKNLIALDHEWLKNAAAYKGLVNCNCSKEDLLNEPLQELFIDSFYQILPLNIPKKEFIEFYEKIFGSSRHPNGLLNYSMGIKSLNEDSVLNCLKTFVTSVFKGDFIQKRYNTENNTHLKLIEEKAPHVLEKWKSDYSFTYESAAKSDESRSEPEEKLDMKNWLKTKIIDDKHIELKEDSYLKSYLNGEETFEVVEKKLTDKIKELKSLKKNQKNSQKDLINSYEIQLSCLELAKKGINGKNLEEIRKRLNETTEFKNDIQGLLKDLSQKKKDLKKVVATTTDNPLDLFFLGTDVSGSCQRLDGEPNLNKGLLGYVMDGKIRLLAVKDENGKILSRGLLRILWDGEKPVLNLDRFYPNDLSEIEKNALTELAKKIGQELSLTVTKDHGTVPYEKPLKSLPGPAPYEYSDHARGIQTYGEYTLPQVYLV